MNIECNRLDRGYQLYKEEFDSKAIEVLNSGWYILGRELENFEKQFADFLGAKYCVGVASGLDALIMAVRLLDIGKGDEVIVQGNTYIASVMGITLNGATPVFVEPNKYNNIDADKIEERITEKTKAIMVVHLYGQASKMDTIVRLAHKYNLQIIEDCAQSHGATFQNQMTGTFGAFGCFSFYPTKNLGAFGDAGALVTDNEELYQKAKILRNYGSDRKNHFLIEGMNSRLDEMQAGLLSVRLKHIKELNMERNTISHRYHNEIHNSLIEKPQMEGGATSVWHQYVIHTAYRTKLIEYLKSRNIQTMIHYPIPPHLSDSYQNLNIARGSLPVTEKFADEVLSLPIYNGMKKEEIDYVIDCINQFTLS